MTTEEMQAEVAKLFSGRNAKFTVTRIEHKGVPAVVIECGAMYSRPTYTGERGLVGMLAHLQRIGGGDMVDEYGERNEESRCETCDWGSFYARSFVVYTPEVR